MNEGNVAKEFTYVFSTGKYIDSNKLEGKVQLAETGKLDSTLLVALYDNITDTAVLKLKPTYIAKLNGNGSFRFHHLPSKLFNVFVMPNDYSKKYDDSTKLFGFLNNARMPIIVITIPPTIKIAVLCSLRNKEINAVKEIVIVIKIISPVITPEAMM